MRTKGEVIIDHKRGLVYRVKEVRGRMLIIERVRPSPHVLTNLDFLDFLDRNAIGEKQYEEREA